jgi:ribosomal protein S18 acetylase RimI-like enzyme
MIEDWHRRIEIAIPFEQWEQLPRLPGFKSEYYGGRAVWTPRPKLYNAVLDFTTIDLATLLTDAGNNPGEGMSVRSLHESDWDPMCKVFAAAFHKMPPFCALSGDEREKAAADCLNRTRGGGEGEFLEDASVVARDSDGGMVGAILVTRWKPYGGDWGPRYNPDVSAHLTWAFVRPLDSGMGFGTLMLRESVERLQRMGFRHLLTTFLAGNESSMLWHWRNGFRLLPYIGSRRAIGDRRQMKTAGRARG